MSRVRWWPRARVGEPGATPRQSRLRSRVVERDAGPLRNIPEPTLSVARTRRPCPTKNERPDFPVQPLACTAHRKFRCGDRNVNDAPRLHPRASAGCYTVREARGRPKPTPRCESSPEWRASLYRSCSLVQTCRCGRPAIPVRRTTRGVGKRNEVQPLRGRAAAGEAEAQAIEASPRLVREKSAEGPLTVNTHQRVPTAYSQVGTRAPCVVAGGRTGPIVLPLLRHLAGACGTRPGPRR